MNLSYKTDKDTKEIEFYIKKKMTFSFVLPFNKNEISEGKHA